MPRKKEDHGRRKSDSNRTGGGFTATPGAGVTESGPQDGNLLYLPGIPGGSNGFFSPMGCTVRGTGFLPILLR